MPYFKKKPVVIEAIKYDGKNTEEVIAFCRGTKTPALLLFSRVPGSEEVTFALRIRTLEGEMLVSEGDWVIKGVAGECYPCKPEIFEASYDEQEEVEHHA